MKGWRLSSKAEIKKPTSDTIVRNNMKLTKIPEFDLKVDPKKIWLSGNPISSFIGLPTFHNLQELRLDNTNITSFLGITEQPSLRSISFLHTPLSEEKYHREMAGCVFFSEALIVNGIPLSKSEFTFCSHFWDTLKPNLVSGFLLTSVSPVRLFDPVSRARKCIYFTPEMLEKKQEEKKRTEMAIQERIRKADEKKSKRVNDRMKMITISSDTPTSDKPKKHRVPVENIATESSSDDEGTGIIDPSIQHFSSEDSEPPNPLSSQNENFDSYDNGSDEFNEEDKKVLLVDSTSSVSDDSKKVEPEDNNSAESFGDNESDYIDQEEEIMSSEKNANDYSDQTDGIQNTRNDIRKSYSDNEYEYENENE